ncbi:uncharacterized protein A4U43_C04F9800 [Asparagus officinalis]|uniref:FAR1 domain-containing protein n=1 Tax=Asparagus officinalis TaxID=4686 RepID=A0A5P1F4H1_ASPOF|nr:uncharacterized protein LOC109836983 isoform X2 [Asparagus officinalis]ONK71551.1 uncharacterized protein A4U43_C04F9800 [Asparagus officinalis]
MDEVIIEPQIGNEEDESMMQLDIEPFNGDSNNSNEVKGELDLVASEGETNLEPYEGMEFESEEAARAFYSSYARHVGFRVRISRYTRSRRDNSIISRLIVCSKEGFRESRGSEGVFGGRKQHRQRAVTRVGCKAMIMVKKVADGRWVVSKFVKEHNHGPVPPRKLEVRVVQKEEDSMEELNVLSDGGAVHEPVEGMEFDSEEDARTFYLNYARQMGFRARISKYCRSRKDNSIISRQIVCSKEGFRELRIKKEETNDGRAKRPRVVTRIGCKAMIIVKKLSTGKWVVSRFEKEHNHALATSKKEPWPLQASNDCNEKGRVTYVVGEHMPSNVGMVMSGDCCNGSRSTSQESLTVLYNQLCYDAIRFAQEGAVSEEIYNVATSALKEAVDKVAAAKRTAAAVANGVKGGHGSCMTKCSNEPRKAGSGNEVLLMQQPVKFVLIPSTSLANDSKPANSPIMVNVPNSQGITVSNPTSLKQTLVNAKSVKELVGNNSTNHMDAIQNSQNTEDTGASQAQITPGNDSDFISSGVSESKMVAFPALPVTFYMPVMGNLSESSSGNAGSNAYTLVAAPVNSSPVASGTQSRLNIQQSVAPSKDQNARSCTGPNPKVHATAIAAGARIVPPQEAASLIKVIEAKVRSSRSSLGSGCKQLGANVAPCKSKEEGPRLLNPVQANVEAIEGKEQASSEEMRLQESGEGFKEMEAATMDHSAVYDSGEDHLFSDAGS